MAFNEVSKLITLRSPSILFEKINLSSRNKENRILIESSCQKESCYHNAFSFWNMYIKKLNIPNILILVFHYSNISSKLTYLVYREKDQQRTGSPLTLICNTMLNLLYCFYRLLLIIFL